MPMASVPFQFYMPMVDLSKSDEGHMLFGGFSSSQATDLEGEDVIQKGLDFTDFVHTGWFNENHDSKLTGGGVVGVPVPNETVTWLKKGQAKPLNGEAAERAGWYVQGEMLDTEEGRSIWDKAVALKKTKAKRHLGMSLEGEVIERDGPKILKAKVRNIALTQRPVNQDTTMEVLTKAFTGEGPWVSETTSPELELLQQISGQLDAFMKALAAGSEIDNPDPTPRVVGNGGKAPEPTKKALTAGAAIDAPSEPTPGDGFAMRQEDLDGVARPTDFQASSTDPMVKVDGSSMGHDGISGSVPKIDSYFDIAKAETAPEAWSPELAYAHFRKRYPHMGQDQRAALVDHMFRTLGGT